MGSSPPDGPAPIASSGSVKTVQPFPSCHSGRKLSRIGTPALSVLFRLQEAQHPGSADAPGFRLHPLQGDRAGQWSVRVSGNWRVVFRFEEGEAVEVDLVDYH